MSKALDGVRILDFTHVQSGPTCTQLLAWFGADVIKVEKAGEGDATRGQLRDIPGVDSLYFTMLNHNKRSITVNTKDPKGKEVLDRDPVHGQERGIFWVEIGVLITVSSTMLTFYYAFAGRGR